MLYKIWQKKKANRQQGQEMTQRPLSVTIIAWFATITSIILMIQTSVNKEISIPKIAPLPISFLLGVGYVGFLIQIVSAIGMLKGKNWARLLYVAWVPISLVITISVAFIYKSDFDRTTLIAPFLFYLTEVFFLFRPKANEYFGQQKYNKGNI